MSIDSNGGRFGSLWWINSDLQPRTEFVPVMVGIHDTGMVVKRKLIRWGAFGLGRDLRVSFEVIDD